ncbi:MAG: hypothetical protein AB1815_08810 [Bacillota bacterium]
MTKYKGRNPFCTKGLRPFFYGFAVKLRILPHLVKLCRLNVVLSLDSANIQRGLIPPLNEVSSDS